MYKGYSIFLTRERPFLVMLQTVFHDRQQGFERDTIGPGFTHRARLKDHGQPREMCDITTITFRERIGRRVKPGNIVTARGTTWDLFYLLIHKVMRSASL